VAVPQTAASCRCARAVARRRTTAERLGGQGDRASRRTSGQPLEDCYRQRNYNLETGF
jgi:hypothetical protein